MRVTFPLIPAASTTTVSVQVSGFEDNGLLTHCDCLLCDSCSSGQCFAFSFLQIPPRDGHPCRSANRSPCRADSGLSPPSHPPVPEQRQLRRYAPYLAHHKKAPITGLLVRPFISIDFNMVPMAGLEPARALPTTPSRWRVYQFHHIGE